MSLVCSVIFIHHAFNANILDKDYAFSDGEILMVDNAVRTHFEPYERHFKEIGFNENTIKKYLQCTNIQTVTVPVPAKFLRASNVPTGLLNEMIAYLNSEERNHHNFSELLLFSCLSIFAACKGFITLLTNGVLSVSGKVRNIVNMKLAHPWKLTQIYGEHKNTDNPDQRIAEDILLLISKTLSLSFGFIQSLSMLITFTVILWQSAGTLSFTVGGTEWSIQGYMVYTVVLIVIGGTLFTHKVGKRIRPLNVEKQRSEATFRTNLVQHNKQAELIALSNAESLQRQELSENFHTIKENWHRLMNRQRWLDYWQNIYSRSLSVLPYFLLLPQFISGQINLGGLMKSRQAFMLVSNNLSWFIYKYDELAELAAVIDRLYEFHQLTEQRPTNKPKNCQHAVQVADASIRTPDNKIILENLNFHVSPGKWLLLKGYSGAGKTTLLKTLSHCWPWFKGDISSPADSWYVSQTPLIKTGLLKEIICKALPLSVDDKSLSEVLHQVGLGKLAARIHDHDRWGDILSSGEKQRIALARLILRRPKWIFLDETTSHLEEQEAIRLLRLVREKLPTSDVIMVTHQPGVWNLVDDICDISAVI